MTKFLIITKEKDYIASSYKRIAKQLGEQRCMVYDADGRLVYPEWLWDGDYRIWAKEFIRLHHVGDATADVVEWYYRPARN